MKSYFALAILLLTAFSAWPGADGLDCYRGVSSAKTQVSCSSDKQNCVTYKTSKGSFIGST